MTKGDWGRFCHSGFRLLLLLATCSVASRPPLLVAENADEIVFTPGPGISAPRVIKEVEPKISDDARQRGTVVIELVVNAEGRPEKMRVIHGLNERTDQSALDAVKHWEFSPAIRQGVPVAVRITIELRFHDV